MGLPTPEDPNVKKSTLAIVKEKDRLAKLMTDRPQYMYLIETVASLVRCCTVDAPAQLAPAPGEPSTLYSIPDLGFRLSQDNLVLFNPDVQFITNLFMHAHKARAAVALSKAYVHYFFYDEAGVKKLFKIVRTGLEECDNDRIRPFLILF